MSVSGPVSGGGALTPDEREDAKAVLEAATVELTTVRAAAEKWQVGLAGLATGIGAYAVLRGDDQIAKIASPWSTVAGLAIALSFGLTLLAGVLAIRAAYGLPRRRSTVGLDLAADDHTAAVRSAQLLRAAMWITVFAVLAIFGAMAISWFAPKAAPLKVRVTVEGGEQICGEVLAVRDGNLLLKTDDGERSTPMKSLVAVAPKASCV